MFDPDPTLDALLQKLVHPQLKVIDPSLDRIHRLLAALGNPQDSLPPVVHVAGTNGKGSLIAYLRAILTAAGFRVHAYTSPHLVRFNERIRLGGEPIAMEQLMPILERILSMQEDYPATFFEATTTAAFVAIREYEQSYPSKCEARSGGERSDGGVPPSILLLETGMGGRLDATNVIARPAVTAITPIGVDHAEFLGDTIAKIAAEKAAIIKPGRPCVVGPQPAEALAVIERVAAQKNAPLFFTGEDFPYPPPALPGRHQVRNAVTALAVLEHLPDFPVSAEAITTGLQAVDWPARLQRLDSGYWRNFLPEGWELYLDGGHNPHAGQAIAEWLASPCHLILGMLGNKDLRGYLEPLADRIAHLYAVPIPGEAGCYPAEEITEIARSMGIAADPFPSVEAALEAVSRQSRNGMALIAGSLYLAGHVLGKN